MNAPSLADRAALERRSRRFLCRLAGLATASMLAALAGSCAPRSPFVGPEPSDPSARTRPVGYRSTLAPYVSQRPVEPTSWQEQNERVAPSARPTP